MRSKQVQILSGICGVQLIGYACRAAGFKTDIWIGFAGSVFLMLDIVYLAIQEKGRKVGEWIFRPFFHNMSETVYLSGLP